MIPIKVLRRGVEIREEEAETIIGHLSMALDRFEHLISGLTVTLADHNGPKGGVDKECKVQAKLPRGGLCVVQGLGSSVVYAAQDAGRKAQQVLSKFKRGRFRREKSFAA